MINIKITPELAELAGIHAGDGYLRYSNKRRELDISGDYEEKEYYDYHVIPLINKLFKISIKGKYFPSRKTYGFVIYDKTIVEQLASLGYPSGKKTTIVNIPKLILNHYDIKIIVSFLRGYFDTDGSLTFDKKIRNPSDFQKKYNYYPRLMFTTCSCELKNNLLFLFKRLGFICKCYTQKSKIETENLKYKLQITGKEALIKWMKLIGSKNPSKISRYLIWEKYGFCPPNTTYNQRINILEGKLNPYLMYEGPIA